ncbi:hypothetical protein HNR67_007946 [Crossiella cryophila]|uniref:Uncharacterized protein n=1 Tax=Crossiella cryophila TaxID=43355 RepID=A0A7W7CL77_9PSEU|nr:hypothetical protein [Crossiella cryophila]
MMTVYVVSDPDFARKFDMKIGDAWSIGSV